MPEQVAVVVSPEVYEGLIGAVRDRFPRKAFGYLLSDRGPSASTDFVLFEDNLRNDDAWRSEFESYGHYFVEHADAGFVATPEESWRVQKEIWARGMVEVGVFHSHQRHPGNFSRIDYEMHLRRFSNLWHAIVSMRNPGLPQVRFFDVSERGVRELEARLPTGEAVMELWRAAP
jgi:proteasome lid subunit RPN8/RPN11